jgi:hypothetical protein
MDSTIRNSTFVSDSIALVSSRSTDWERIRTSGMERRSQLMKMVCIALVGWGSIGSMEAKGGGIVAEEYLRKALQAFETRGDQLNPVWLRYVVAEFETKEWRTRGEKNAKQKDKILDRRWKVRVEYARKGDKTRAAMSVDLPASEGGGRTQLDVYNGEIRVETDSGINRYDISRKPGEGGVFGTPWVLTGEEAFYKLVLQKWASGELQLKVTTVSEDHLDDGANAVVLTIFYPTTGVKNKIWLLPDSAYTVHQFEVYGREGQILERSSTTEFSMISGIPIPKRGKSINYYYGKIGKQREFEVESVVLKGSDIPDSLFEVEIPKDAVIYDSDLRALIRDPEQAQAHLEQVLGKLRRDKHPWRVWSILGASLGGMALLASLVMIRRRWRNSKPASRSKS